MSEPVTLFYWYFNILNEDSCQGWVFLDKNHCGKGQNSLDKTSTHIESTESNSQSPCWVQLFHLPWSLLCCLKLFCHLTVTSLHLHSFLHSGYRSKSMLRQGMSHSSCVLRSNSTRVWWILVTGGLWSRFDEPYKLILTPQNGTIVISKRLSSLQPQKNFSWSLAEIKWINAASYDGFLSTANATSTASNSVDSIQLLVVRYQ